MAKHTQPKGHRCLAEEMGSLPAPWRTEEEIKRLDYIGRALIAHGLSGLKGEDPTELGRWLRGAAAELLERREREKGGA